MKTKGRSREGLQQNNVNIFRLKPLSRRKFALA
jgi:hypothetical protein